MATSLAPSASRATTSTRELPWHLAAVVVGASSILIGILWDISWHRTIGRDTFWTPAHMAVYFGGTLAGLSCGARVLWESFGRDANSGDGVRIWRYFTGPIGGWICIWGAFAMLTSAPFDDWWHNAYGLDVEILSPPHVVLLVGIAGILIGAQTMAAAAQNRAESSPLYSNIFLVSSGVLATMAAVAITEYTFATRSHQSLFYIVTGGVYPAILVAAAVASRVRWPATRVALIYMVVMAAQVWILPLIPGSPLLGPIGHEVTVMVPLPFPVLLIAPALAIDLVLRRMEGRNAWLTSLALGVCFVAAFVVVQWPFGSLQATEIGRNAFFGGSHGDYGQSAEFLVGPRQMWTDGKSVAATLLSIATWAVLVATLSARLGLARGAFLRRVVR
jgi:xanthosine utilization system XapX-like protein